MLRLCPAHGRSASLGVNGGVGWPGLWASAWWLEGLSKDCISFWLTAILYYKSRWRWSYSSSVPSRILQVHECTHFYYKQLKSVRSNYGNFLFWLSCKVGEMSLTHFWFSPLDLVLFELPGGVANMATKWTDFHWKGLRFAGSERWEEEH